MPTTDEPAKLSSRFLIWLGVGAVVVCVGVFFLVSSASTEDGAARSRPSTARTQVRPTRAPGSATPVETPAVLSEDVALEVDVEEGEGAPVARGTTNLPDDTALTVTVEDAPTGGKTFQWAQKCSVADGAFESGPILVDGGTLVGEYRITILTPIPSFQAASVQAVIGRNGEHLAGPLVHPSDAHSEYFVVETTRRVVLGGEAGVRKMKFHRAALAAKGRGLASRLERLGGEFEKAARREHESGSWPSYLRDFHQRAAALRTECEAFPRPEIRASLTRAVDDLAAWALARARYGRDMGAQASSDLAQFQTTFDGNLQDARTALKALRVD